MVAPGIDLPADLVWLIYDRLPCPIDRRRMRQVCHKWRTVVTPPNQPRPLPSILLLQAGGPSLSCVFSGCITHRLEFRVEDARTARYFGSFDGGWVFFSIGNHRNTLHNRLADRSFKLPTLFFISKGRHVPFAILAATLSSPPVHGKSVIGAIVLSRSRLRFSAAVRQPAFRRLGQCNAIDKSMVPYILDSEDIIFHKGSFYVLNKGERICVYTPRSDEGEDMGQISVETRYCYFSQGGRHYDEHVAARYLVESRDELLMVVRLTPHRGQPTSAFRVFQMVPLRDRLHLTVDIFDGTAEYTWNERHELDGRVLFVGRGCSRSHQVADHAGFEEEGVYFLDDGSFSDGDKDKLLLQNSDQLQFSCTDSGRWSAPTRQIESFFPEQVQSSYSPPVWILP